MALSVLTHPSILVLFSSIVTKNWSENSLSMPFFRSFVIAGYLYFEPKGNFWLRKMAFHRWNWQVTHFGQLGIISAQTFFCFAHLFWEGEKLFRGKLTLVLVRWLKIEPVSVSNLFIHCEFTWLNPYWNELLKKRYCVFDISWKRWHRTDWLTKHALQFGFKILFLAKWFFRRYWIPSFKCKGA